MWAENKACKRNLQWETNNNFLSNIMTNSRKASAIGRGGGGSVCTDSHKNEYFKWKHLILYAKNSWIIKLNNKIQ